MKIRVLNYKLEKYGKNSGECIMRGRSPLANPFPVEPWGPYKRGESLVLYEPWIRSKIAEQDLLILKELDRLKHILLSKGELGLVCGCFPKACHGDIIKTILLEKLADDLI